jgi:hypothetical protein
MLDEENIDDSELLLEDVAEDEVKEEESEPEVSFGDEELEEEDAPDLPKKLRNEIKERDCQLVVMRQQLEEAQKKSAPVAVEVGPRPRLEDFDYDEDKHNAALDEYEDRKVSAALQKQNEVADDGLLEEAQNDVAKFQTGIQSLAFADAKQVTEAVTSALPANLQYVIAATANDPATFTYALGKHPARLQEILSIKNPTKQIAAIVRMEATLKVGQSRKAPEPDRPSKGNASAAVNPDKHLAKLEAEAARTGDRTALIRYRREISKA